MGLEGGMACAELIAEDTDTPHIDHLVVVLANDDLWGDVVKCATECDAFSK